MRTGSGHSIPRVMPLKEGNALKQWFPNWEPRLPGEPRLPPRGVANYGNFSQFYPSFIILFQFADVDIHSFIHSFILNIYIAPLQENYSEALPTPARSKMQS